MHWSERNCRGLKGVKLVPELFTYDVNSRIDRLDLRCPLDVFRLYASPGPVAFDVCCFVR